MKKQRTAALLLTLLALGTAASCGSTDSGNATDTANAVSDTAAVTKEPSIYDTLPEQDYGGYTFRILNNISNFAYTNMGEDGQTGETLDDVIFERNAKVEEALNITLKVEALDWEPNKTAIQNSVTAGEDAYDIYFNELHFVLGHALNSYLFDMSEIETLNFDNPWWDKSAITSASIGEPIYAAFGDLHLMYYECFFPVVFNKQIISNLDLEDPYTLVEEGAWTLDVMSEMAKAAQNDIDGDGKWTAADNYGYALFDHNNQGFINACNIDIVTKDGNNMPVWKGLTDEFVSVYDKLATTLFADPKNNAQSASGFKSTEHEASYVHTAMLDGHTLFYVEPLGSVKKMRDVDYEIGVLPMPKLDESQEDYRSYIYHGAGSMGIPKTNPDTDRTGVIAEYLAAYSHETVRQTYFDETLDFKYIQDDKGQAMLDIIFANGTVDLAKVYAWGGLADQIKTKLSRGNSDIASTFEKYASKTEAAIANTIEALNEAKE